MADGGPIGQHRVALERWITALNSLGDRPAVDAAVHPTIRIERYGFGRRVGQLVEIIEGPGPVAAWLSKTPPATTFSVDGDLEVTKTGGRARYRIAVEDFRNGGEWRYQLADDGRLAHLVHVPDNIDDAVEETVAESRRQHALVNQLAANTAAEANEDD